MIQNNMKKKKRRLKKKYKDFLMVYLVLVTLVTAQYSLSKFTTTFSKNSRTSVARPVVNLIGEDINEIEFVQEGDFKYVAEYEFTITNVKDEVINEIDMQYFIEINLGDEFSYSLYKDEIKDENLIQDVENYSSVLGHGVAEEHYYILKIVYEATDYTAAYKTNFDINVLYVQAK